MLDLPRISEERKIWLLVKKTSFNCSIQFIITFILILQMHTWRKNESFNKRFTVVIRSNDLFRTALNNYQKWV